MSQRITKTAIRIAASALVLVGIGVLGSPSHAETEGQERREERRGAQDTRQEGRESARDAKQECREGDEKSRAECRQDKRNTKQDARDAARGVRRGEDAVDQ
jgi:hypothetical protein